MENSAVIRGEEATGRVWLGDKEISLEDSLNFRSHSPTGFSWGYAGSGPAQLSLAILMQFIPPEQAVLIYQEFKQTFTTHWQGNFLEPVENITQWIESKRFGIESQLRVDRLENQSIAA